jgi:hypothetical protein
MHIAEELAKVIGCFIAILYTSDLLLTLHDIRNELRAAREQRKAQVP